MKLVLAVLALVFSAGVQAKPLNRAPQMLDPKIAYILVELRNRDVETLPPGLILAMYDPLVKDLAGAPIVTSVQQNDRVIETTTKSAIVRDFVGSRPLIREKTRRLYLLALQPGIWTIEGTGPMKSVIYSETTSFSLGSPTVSLAGGTITDLGVIEVGGDWKDGKKQPKMKLGDLFVAAMTTAPFAGNVEMVPAFAAYRPRTAADIGIPADIARFSVQPAQWSDTVEFGNHLGKLVNRIGGRAARRKISGL